MTSRVSTGTRPGARFAQFKLVLLGMFASQIEEDLGSGVLICTIGESAVGKVTASLLLLLHPEC